MFMLEIIGDQGHVHQYIFTCNLEIIDVVISLSVTSKEMIPCSNF